MACPGEALPVGHAPFPANRPDGRGYHEEGPAIDEDGRGDRLETVPLERLQLVELERTGKPRAGQPIAMEASGVSCKPAEAPLYRASGDAENACSLPLPNAGDEELQAARIQVWFLLSVVSAKRLTREPATAHATTEARYFMRPS